MHGETVKLKKEIQRGNQVVAVYIFYISWIIRLLDSVYILH